MKSIYKTSFVVLLVFSFIFCCFVPCFGVGYSTYSDVLQNNSTVNNLLSLRSDKQRNLHYIAFRQSSEQYMIVMSDNFAVNNNVVSASNVDIIYYNSEYGSSNSTRYFNMTGTDFSLKINHVVVSDFLDFSSKNETFGWQRYLLILVALILAFVIFNVLRRFK